MNRRPMFSNPLQGEGGITNEQDSKSSQSLSSFFAHKELVCTLLVCILLWFTIDLVYFGINLSLGQLQGSIYFNGYMSGGAQVFSYCVFGIVVNLMGRKFSVVLCFLIGSLACVLYQPSTSLGSPWTYICVLIGKFGGSSSLTIVHLMTSELFPTQFRSTMLGITQFFGLLGGMLGPLIGGFAPNYFMYVFGIMGILSGLASLTLKETKGKEMKDKLTQEDNKGDFVPEREKETYSSAKSLSNLQEFTYNKADQ